jgi:two-component system, cell cycle response regulator DivK
MERASLAVALPLVLVVDDFEDSRFMYAEYLEATGFRVATAGDGEEALEKARALRPDAIVMDLSLPVLDGWEATRILKSDLATSSICIIALTGHGEPAFVKRARDAGCDHFALKPCSPPDLAAMLRGCLPALV